MQSDDSGVVLLMFVLDLFLPHGVALCNIATARVQKWQGCSAPRSVESTVCLRFPPPTDGSYSTVAPVETQGGPVSYFRHPWKSLSLIIVQTIGDRCMGLAFAKGTCSDSAIKTSPEGSRDTGNTRPVGLHAWCQRFVSLKVCRLTIRTTTHGIQRHWTPHLRQRRESIASG